MVILFLLVTGLILATSVVAAIIAARSAIPHRWIWAAIALLGAPGVTVDWDTGAFLDRIAMIQVLSVGVSRSTEPGRHWHLTVAFPLGAVIFLARRRSLRSPERP